MTAPNLICSFCEKGCSEVGHMITGGKADSIICDECVSLCVVIMRDHAARRTLERKLREACDGLSMQELREVLSNAQSIQRLA